MLDEMVKNQESAPVDSLSWLSGIKLNTESMTPFFLKKCYLLAAKSPDPSTQLGAIIINKYGEIIGEGYNTYPEGVHNKPSRLVSPCKYSYIEHAERSAIFYSAKFGYKLNGNTMYCPWFSCTECARAIIRSGIKRIIGHRSMFERTPERWKQSIQTAFQMFEEAKVSTSLYDGRVFSDGFSIKMNGEIFSP